MLPRSGVIYVYKKSPSYFSLQIPAEANSGKKQTTSSKLQVTSISTTSITSDTSKSSGVITPTSSTPPVADTSQAIGNKLQTSVNPGTTPTSISPVTPVDLQSLFQPKAVKPPTRFPSPPTAFPRMNRPFGRPVKPVIKPVPEAKYSFTDQIQVDLTTELEQPKSVSTPSSIPGQTRSDSKHDMEPAASNSVPDQTIVKTDQTAIQMPEIEAIPQPTHVVPASQQIQQSKQAKLKAKREAIRSRFALLPWRRITGAILVIGAAAGIIIPMLPQARMEASYTGQKLTRQVDMLVKPTIAMPPSVPLSFNPLQGLDGKDVVPVNTEFSIIIPKIGVNSNVVATVDPLNPKDYSEALTHGVAHSKTSYFPDQDGAVYLFSHSTNYQWFVKDLNAVFYQVKDLTDGDYIVVFYQGKRYTYQYKSREIVAPKDTSYLLPVTGKRQLILQTCWPPGTTTNRLLIFADLVEVK